MVFAFVDRQMPDDFDAVSAIFGRPGAYRRFKDLLHHRDMLDKWYAFEARETELALREWCAENDIRLSDAAT